MLSQLLILFLLFSPNLIYGSDLPLIIKDKKLIEYSNSKSWKKLIHLEEKNKIIDLNSPFYISQNYNGVIDPYLELKSTIAAFLNPEEYLKLNRGHPYCMFPARLRQLKKIFNLQIQDIFCPAYVQWRNYLNLNKVSIIYASQFISNPASIMGHLFIKFKNLNTEDYLNASIGYVAMLPSEINPFSYIFDGLTGRFNGFFHEGYYFEKVHEYNNMETRDIWEYDLNLTNEESEYLVEHVWELKQNSQIPYYFLTQNCASIILSLLETIRPIDFNSKIKNFYLTPIEVLKKIEAAHMIESEVYRPSIRSLMNQKYNNLSSNDKNHVLSKIYLKNKENSENSLVNDTILDYIALKRFTTKTPIDPSIQNLELETLKIRSKQKNEKQFQLESPLSPLNSHNLQSINFGLGTNSNELNYFIFELHPLNHYLLDSQKGFLSNSALDFFNINFRYLISNRSLQNFQFKLLEIANFTPLQMLDPQISWRFISKFQNQSEFSELSSGVFIAPSIGLTFFLSKYLFIYSFMNFQEQFISQSKSRTLLGFELGTVFNLDEKYKLMLIAKKDEEIKSPIYIISKYSCYFRINNIYPHLHLDLNLDENQLTLLETRAKNITTEFSLKLNHDFQ